MTCQNCNTAEATRFYPGSRLLLEPEARVCVKCETKLELRANAALRVLRAEGYRLVLRTDEDYAEARTALLSYGWRD